MNKPSVIGVLLGVLVSFGLVVPAFADSRPEPGHGHFERGFGLVGTVSAISGTNITMSGRSKPGASATTTVYTVDAANAKIVKTGAASSTISAIAVGDTVLVRGSVNGTTVAATTIIDGLPQREQKDREGGKGPHGPLASVTPTGAPVVAGSIASVSGNSFTLDARGTTYSVDAASSTVIKSGATSSVSSLIVGDSALVQGTVNGTSVIASLVIDKGAARAPATSTVPGIGRGFHLGQFLHTIFRFFGL